MPKTRCAGWVLDGDYEVTTDEFGKSQVRVSATLSPPEGKSLSLRSVFGLSWTVGIGKDKVETYLAFWNPKQRKWLFKNWMRRTGLKTAQQNALKGMKKSDKKNNMWAHEQPIISDGKVVITATRQFDAPEGKKYLFGD